MGYLAEQARALNVDVNHHASGDGSWKIPGLVGANPRLPPIKEDGAAAVRSKCGDPAQSTDAGFCSSARLTCSAPCGHIGRPSYSQQVLPGGHWRNSGCSYGLVLQ